MSIVLVGKQIGGFLGVLTAQTINFALTGGTGESVPAAGDFVIVSYLVATDTNRTLIIQNTGATAYTLFGVEQYRSWTYDVNLRVAYRVMPGTPETQFVLSETVTGGTADVAQPGSYGVSVWRGVNATPLEQAVVQGTAQAADLPDPGSITPTTTGTVIVVIGAGASNSVANFTASDLTDFRTISQQDTFGRAHLGIGHKVWTSGAFDGALWGTTTDSGGSWATTVIALAPAAGGGATRPNKLLGLIDRQQPL